MGLDWPILRDLLTLRKRLDGVVEGALAEDGLGLSPSAEAPSGPPADVYETDREIVITVEMPGVDTGSVSVDLTGNRLRVGASVAPVRGSGDARLLRMERAKGSLQRTFRLPVGTFEGSPTAEIERGVLTVRLTKASSHRRHEVAVTES